MAIEESAKVLRIGVLHPIDAVDPVVAHDAESMLVLRQVCQPLFETVGSGLEVEPALVDEVIEPEPGAERPVVRLRIRSGVRFSDGSPMSARDVWRSLMAAPLIRTQATVRRDSEWLELSLLRPDPGFRLALSHSQCCVCRRHQGTVVGTGPFALDPASRPRAVRLVRNPHHPDPPRIDAVRFDTFPPDDDGRPTRLIAGLERGEVDLSFAVPHELLYEIRGVRAAVWPSLSTGMLFFNTESPSLRPPAVRRALALAIDRYAVARSCFRGALPFVAGGPLPNALSEAEDRLSFDPDRARRTLDAQPVRPGRLVLVTVWAPRPYLPNPEAAARTVAGLLAPLGIEVEIRTSTSSADYLAQVAAGTADLVLAGWVAESTDPCDYLEALLGSDRVTTVENASLNANHARLRSEAMDAALARYRASRTDEALDAVIRRLEHDVPFVPLTHGATTVISSPRVKNLEHAPLPTLSLARLDLAVDPALQRPAGRAGAA